MIWHSQSSSSAKFTGRLGIEIVTRATSTRLTATMIRFRKILLVLSGTLWVLSFVLFLLSYRLPLATHNDALGLHSPYAARPATNMYCAASDGSIWLFNSAVPYTGSLRFLDLGDGRITDGQWVYTHRQENVRWQLGNYGWAQLSYIAEGGQVGRVETACNFPGIYYRHFDVLGEPQPWWTLGCSFTYPLLIFGCWPVSWIIRKLEKQKLLGHEAVDRDSHSNGNDCS